MATFRGFIAIDIPLNEHLRNLLESLQKTHAQIKLVEPENIHITLKFLGDTQEHHIDSIEQMMQESVQTTSPFTMTLKGTGVFPNEKYVKILWVG
ncbi:MAG: RNA 2',3'-cyclic phosphodiesterase, partial [Thermoplasmatota archaeon]